MYLRPHPSLVALTLTASLTVTACGTASPTPVADASATGDAAADARADGGTTSDAQVGAFQVQLVAPTDAGAGYTSVVGRVQDGATPQALVWVQRAMDGDCKLLVPRVPFCSPSCSNAVCVEDGVCRPNPTGQDVGTVRVTGVRASTGETGFDLISIPSTRTYQAPGTVMLPFPAFAEGDAIRVAASGSAWTPAFALDARGIAPLALGASSYRMQTGMPLALTWTAARQATASTITVHLDISHHGGTKGKVTCETADDGELTIGANLITQLIALGVAGYPTIVLTRAATGSASVTSGRVVLNVSSVVEVPVDLPNVRSCTSDTDCSGGTCRPDLTCG